MNPAKAFVPQLRQNSNPFIFTSAKLGVRACEIEKVSECVRMWVMEEVSVERVSLKSTASLGREPKAQTNPSLSVQPCNMLERS